MRSTTTPQGQGQQEEGNSAVFHILPRLLSPRWSFQPFHIPFPTFKTKGIHNNLLDHLSLLIWTYSKLYAACIWAFLAFLLDLSLQISISGSPVILLSMFSFSNRIRVFRLTEKASKLCLSYPSSLFFVGLLFFPWKTRYHSLLPLLGMLFCPNTSISGEKPK